MIRKQGHSIHWLEPAQRLHIVLSWRLPDHWWPLVQQVEFRRQAPRAEWTLMLAWSPLGVFMARERVRRRGGRGTEDTP